MKSLRIALGQIQVKLAQPQENMGLAHSLARRASIQGAHLLLLPEIWTSGYDLDNAEMYAAYNQDCLAELQQIAADENLWIGGSYITARGGNLYNTFRLISPDGSTPSEYQKTHLFRLLGEENTFAAGDEPVMASTPWGNFGLAICYDLRFPELFRSYGRAGSPLTILVAEWGAPRREHWRVFLRARAIENQMFVAAVNTCGQIGGVEYAGHSAVIDPWGDVLVEGGDEEALLVTDVDFERIDEAKRRLSSWEDDRPDVYQRWLNSRIIS